MVLELASLKKKKKKKKEEEVRKKMTIFDFFKIRLLSFCTAELKSEDIFVLRRVRAFSGYSFCWLNPQICSLFTLAYCTVKTFQPPSSLHRDCYRIATLIPVRYTEFCSEDADGVCIRSMHAITFSQGHSTVLQHHTAATEFAVWCVGDFKETTMFA